MGHDSLRGDFEAWLEDVDSTVELLTEPFDSDMASEGRYDSLLTAIVEDWVEALKSDETKFEDIRTKTQARLDRYEPMKGGGDQAVLAAVDSLGGRFAELAERDEWSASQRLGEEIAGSFTGTKNNFDLLRGYYRASFLVMIAYWPDKPFGEVQLNAMESFFRGLSEFVYPLRFTRYPRIEDILLQKPRTRESQQHTDAVAFFGRKVRRLERVNDWLFRQTQVGEHLGFFAILDADTDREFGEWVERGIVVSIEAIMELGVKPMLKEFTDEQTLLLGVIRYCQLILQRPIYGRGALGGSLSAIDDTIGTSFLAFVPEDLRDEAEAIFLRGSMNGLVGSFASVYVVLVAVIASPHRPFVKERCLMEAHAAMRERLDTRGGPWDEFGQQVIKYLLEKEIEWLPRFGFKEASARRLQEEARELLSNHFADCASLRAPGVLMAERQIAAHFGFGSG